MKIYKKINLCRLCRSRNLHKVFDLKKQYIQGSFQKKKFPKPCTKKIPLKLVLCKFCGLLQTQHTTNKSILYKNYWYMSKINSTMRNHLKDIVISLCKIKKEKKLSVLDIGCNDGTFLNFFSKNVSKYGIDPSQIIKKIDKKKINTIKDFFPPKRKNLMKINKKFDFISSIAMFYDIDDPNHFVRAIKYFLEKKGIWIFELSYMIDMLRLNSFDTICHEHLEYYSLSTLNFLMKKNKLKIFKVSKNLINGGSIRCFVTHKDNFIFDKKQNYLKINKLIKYEKKIKILSKKPYKKFYLNSLKIRKKLLNLINKIKKKEKKIYILGASTKGNTILQFLNIDNKIISTAVERNKEKIGATTIGSNIKIISENLAKKNIPDYYLVLPWHFKKEIINREKDFIKKGGSLIFPLPNVHVVNRNNYKQYM